MVWVRGSFFFFQAEDGIRDLTVTGVQTCALPIWRCHSWRRAGRTTMALESRYRIMPGLPITGQKPALRPLRSEEHTSELQSQSNLVCRLLLEKKKKKDKQILQRGKHLHNRSIKT